MNHQSRGGQRRAGSSNLASFLVLLPKINREDRKPCCVRSDPVMLPPSAGSWESGSAERDGREFFLTSDGESGSRSALLASSSTAAIELITLYARLDNAGHKMAPPLSPPPSVSVTEKT